jgi:3-hydroxyacyl-CoA dehydrogenase/enoyl-CoA hydratase/3-hydroxybutyryl-CoA epimerase
MPSSDSLQTDRLRLDVTDDGVATVWIDVPDASVNTISEATLDAFAEALGVIEADGGIRGVVFISGKEDTFIAGADLDMLRSVEMPADARALSRRAHRLVARVQALDAPTVAAIHGPALGGGLELTLGCSYRIATSGDATRLATPEVKLGILPGGGGTQYLPRLIGVQEALTMMLTGKNVYPKKAKRIGLVDALIHPPGLHRAAQEAVRRLARGDLEPTQGPAKQDLGDRLLESTALSRRIIYQQAGQRAAEESRGNYPAPPKIIECVRVGMDEGLDRGLDAETRCFGELVFTPESRALVSLFFAKRRGDTNPHADAAGPTDTLGVVGAGLMGAGIAEVSAKNGCDVTLKDRSLELAAEGKKHVWTAATKRADKGIIRPFTRDRIVERVTPSGSYDRFARCDLVIEAVPEDLDLKRSIVDDVEGVVDGDAVIASNTSSLPIADIAAAAERPERVLGMHYFSPVAQIPLLEIIVTEDTSQRALATAYAAGRRQGKTVIVVNDGPGFYTTRILALYMNEALLLLEEGADGKEVDEAMKDFGFPMGPYELFDLVGIDVGAKITEVMRERLDRDTLTISDSARGLSKAGFRGQKNERGFYHYEPGPAGDKDPTGFNEGIYGHFGSYQRTALPAEVVQERLALTMVAEAIRCLGEGILESPVDGDLGAVFGLGFPPFLGGPFHYADREGAGALLERLERLAATHGPRFEPPALLRDHAEAETAFHDSQ